MLQRLRDDCALTTSLATASVCLGLEGAPEANVQQAVLEQQAMACEIEDPNADVTCLKYASCEDIEAGVCGRSKKVSSRARLTCTTECISQERGCVDECGSRASWDACTSCELDCVRARTDCADACPE